MTLTWVVGGSGLVGSAVVRERAQRGDELFAPPIPWRDPADAVAALRRGVATLLDHVERTDSQGWRIVWCAGVATTRSSAGDLDTEVAVFKAFCDSLATLASRANARGALAIASSAGGAWAQAARPGPDVPVITEHTAPCPDSAYGAAKLAMEACLADLGVPALAARISNAYGPGQDLGKPQGLITRLLVSARTGELVQLWVPTTTARDYIYCDDVAARLSAALERVAALRPDDPVVKIISSQTTTSIAQLVTMITQVTGTVPLIEVASTLDGPGTELPLRSQTWPDLDVASPTISLTDGVRRTLNALREGDPDDEAVGTSASTAR